MDYLQVASCSDRSQLLWQLLYAAVVGLQLLQDHTQQTLLAQALHTSCCVHSTYLETCIAASSEAQVHTDGLCISNFGIKVLVWQGSGVA